MEMRGTAIGQFVTTADGKDYLRLCGASPNAFKMVSWYEVTDDGLDAIGLDVTLLLEAEFKGIQ